MKKSILATLILLGIVTLIAGAAAARMITVSNYMNAAAAYAATHVGELPIPQPLNGSQIVNPALKISTDAYYGDAVEVQITRRYQSLQQREQDFTATYFYAPQGNAWQLVPPPVNFWGKIETTSGERVIVNYPQRNTKLVTNLIKVLDPALQTACLHWGCAADLKPLTITFVTDPTAHREPLTFLTPQFTGVPMSKQANDDYLTNIAAESLIYLAQTLGTDSPYARAFAYREIQQQNLYANIPDFKTVPNATVPRPSEVWAINADRSTLADGVALSFVNFALSQTSVSDAEALKAIATSSSFNEWAGKLKLTSLEAEWLKRFP